MNRRMIYCILITLIFGTVLLCAACTNRIQIRFVDKTGNDLSFADWMVPLDTPYTVMPTHEEQKNAAPDTNPTDTGTSADAPAATKPVEAEHVNESVDSDPSSAARTPTSKEEILAFYKTAVEHVKNGEAGYARKTWESATVKKVTGISAIDRFVSNEVNKRATPETEAETVVYDKGTIGAIEQFPACSLNDPGNIESATCTLNGDRYILKIVMKDEDTPASLENSMLGEITDIIIFKKELERELTQKLTAVKNYEYNIRYKGFEVDCELTRDGRFITVQHHAVGYVHVSTVQILFVTMKDKDATIYMDALYSDFQY